jgi:hypothetical protein
MSQRPDDFFADLGRFGASDELRPVYERLDADARAWSVTVGDETALIAFAQSLPHRSREETMGMQPRPNRSEWEATQRPPYTNPDYAPKQRPSRLRMWVAVVAAALVVTLLGGSFYILQTARNNGTSTTPATPSATTTQPTATPTSLPNATATITAATVRTLTATQYDAVCPTVGIEYAVSFYQIGDIYLAISLTSQAYPASKLPAGTPLKPFKLGSASDPNRGLPAKPYVNPSLNGGLYVTVCNASKTVSHHIDGLTVRVESFVPFTGDLNSWQFCDSYYQNGQVGGGGCGGGATSDVDLKAAFAANAGAGAVVPATVDSLTNNQLPFTRQPGQSADMRVALTPPTTLGTYHFSFSLTMDDARLPFAALTADLLLGLARKWTGEACATPAMQSQIPTGSTDAYICPES